MKKDISYYIHFDGNKDKYGLKQGYWTFHYYDFNKHCKFYLKGCYHNNNKIGYWYYNYRNPDIKTELRNFFMDKAYNILEYWDYQLNYTYRPEYKEFYFN